MILHCPLNTRSCSRSWFVFNAFLFALSLLFHNKIKVWEEIEAKINAADDPPPLDTPNKVGLSAYFGDAGGLEYFPSFLNTPFLCSRK